MQLQRFIIGSALIMLTGCQHGTTTVVPQTSRTANVHNVKVGLNEISPTELTVGVGD
jgi:hypothetical protein